MRVGEEDEEIVFAAAVLETSKQAKHPCLSPVLYNECKCILMYTLSNEKRAVVTRRAKSRSRLFSFSFSFSRVFSRCLLLLLAVPLLPSSSSSASRRLIIITDDNYKLTGFPFGFAATSINFFNHTFDYTKSFAQIQRNFGALKWSFVCVCAVCVCVACVIGIFNYFPCSLVGE